MIVLTVVYAAYLLALLSFCAWVRTKVQPWVYSLGWAIWCTVWCIFDVFQHNQLGVAINGGLASYWWREFWKQKPPRMRDRVAKLIGAKARAVRDKLVENMPKPSPVPIPVGV